MQDNILSLPQALLVASGLARRSTRLLIRKQLALSWEKRTHCRFIQFFGCILDSLSPDISQSPAQRRRELARQLRPFSSPAHTGRGVGPQMFRQPQLRSVLSLPTAPRRVRKQAIARDSHAPRNFEKTQTGPA